MLELLKQLGMQRFTVIDGEHYLSLRDAAGYLGVQYRNIEGLFYHHPDTFGKYKLYQTSERGYRRDGKYTTVKPERFLSIKQFYLVCMYIKRGNKAAELFRFLFAGLLVGEPINMESSSVETLLQLLDKNIWEAGHEKS